MTYVAHVTLPRDSPSTDQWAEPKVRLCQLLSSFPNWLGDLWWERGSEVVERDKVSSFPAGGCCKKTNLSSKCFCSGLFLLHSKSGSASCRGDKGTCQPSQGRCSKLVLTTRCSLFKIKGHGKDLPQPNFLCDMMGDLIRTAWAPANVLHYSLVDSAVPKEAEV